MINWILNELIYYFVPQPMRKPIYAFKRLLKRIF